MFQRVRKHINPATILAFTALIFAITGGAFAATGGGDSHATLTASIAKKKAKAPTRGPAGPKGATGAAGAAGPAGPAGAAGAKGENGAAGAPGTTGTGTEGKEGKAGESVKTQASSECVEGGTKFTVAGKSENVCNGLEGKQGTPGVPGAIHGQEPLPKGATETGTFTTQQSDAGENSEYIAIPFPIRLAAPITLAEGRHTLYVTIEEWKDENGAKDPAGCEAEPNPVKDPGVKVPGTAEDPQAAEGFLCVYQGYTDNVGGGTFVLTISDPSQPHGNYNELNAGVAGAAAQVYYSGPAELHQLSGTWAVTAP